MSGLRRGRILCLTPYFVLQDTSQSPESKSLLENQHREEQVKSLKGDVSSDNDLDGDIPTVITVDQATDTSLDNR